MQGGKKGLLVNSTDICKAHGKAEVKLTAHSGKRLTLRPVLQSRCARNKKK